MAKKKTTDPIQDKALTPHFFVFMALLIAVTLWALIDEFYLRRPWREHQAGFVEMAEEKLAFDMAYERSRFYFDNYRIDHEIQELQYPVSRVQNSASAQDFQSALGQFHDALRTQGVQKEQLAELSEQLTDVQQRLTRIRKLLQTYRGR